jgi:hypothetical protein
MRRRWPRRASGRDGGGWLRRGDRGGGRRADGERDRPAAGGRSGLRATLAIIRQNIAVALASKALFIVLTLLGLTSLWLAVLADTGVSLLVIANALRLTRAGRLWRE